MAMSETKVPETIGTQGQEEEDDDDVEEADEDEEDAEEHRMMGARRQADMKTPGTMQATIPTATMTSKGY